MVTCAHPSLRTCLPQVVLPTGVSLSQKRVDLGDDDDMDDDFEDGDGDDHDDVDGRWCFYSPGRPFSTLSFAS